MNHLQSPFLIQLIPALCCDESLLIGAALRKEWRVIIMMPSEQ